MTFMVELFNPTGLVGCTSLQCGGPAMAVAMASRLEQDTGLRALVRLAATRAEPLPLALAA
jgi:hypothetical protein